MPKKRILIAGAAGMLGRCLMREWSGTYDVQGSARKKGPGIAACDLTDPSSVKRILGDHSYDLVVNAAAYSDVDGCEREPSRAHASNALASFHLARRCGENKIPYIYVSTDYVFDGRKKSLYAETDRTAPINVYGMTKLEGEIQARKHAWILAVVRTSWLYGAGNPRNFVNQISERLSKEKRASVLADQRDSPTYVKDLSQALERIGLSLMGLAKKKNARAAEETYHVCNRGITTRYEMALKIRDLLGAGNRSVTRMESSEIKGRLALRPQFVSMSCVRYEKQFGVKLRSWQEALTEYLVKAQ